MKNRPEAVLNSKVHDRSSAAHQGFKAAAIRHQILFEAAVVDGEIAAGNQSEKRKLEESLHAERGIGLGARH